MKKLLALLIALIGTGPLLHAVVPCCGVTAINPKTGIVTAKERATGVTFTFQVNAATLSGIHVGSPVYANFSSKQVSLDGRNSAGSIVSIQSPLAAQMTPAAATTRALGVASAPRFSCDANVCSCTGDPDCNDLFGQGLCGGVAACWKSANGTVTCACIRRPSSSGSGLTARPASFPYVVTAINTARGILTLRNAATGMIVRKSVPTSFAGKLHVGDKVFAAN